MHSKVNSIHLEIVTEEREENAELLMFKVEEEGRSISTGKQNCGVSTGNFSSILYLIERNCHINKPLSNSISSVTNITGAIQQIYFVERFVITSNALPQET